LQTIKLRDYRASGVLRDNFLFDGTILENIRFCSNPQATIEEIKAVCRVATPTDSSSGLAQIRNHRQRARRETPAGSASASPSQNFARRPEDFNSRQKRLHRSEARR